MPASDVLKCKIVEQLEPFGDRRLDILAGKIISAIYNVNISDRNKLTKPTDFIPKWDEVNVREPAKPQDIMNFMLALKEIQNARIGRA